MQTAGGLQLVIDADEAAFIQHELSSPNVIVVKAALQRLCAHLERGSILLNGHHIRLLIMASIWSDDTLVRRWSYKAIALLGLGVNSPDALVHRINSETDFENSCWLLGTIAKFTRGESPKVVCDKAGVALDIHYELSARIFSKQNWIGENPISRHLNIDSEDDDTLKWASLLLGYGKAQDNLFHPRLPNATVLRELNRHDNAQVSEYSVWALWKEPNFGRSDLNIPAHEFGSRPAQVKRWINRLMMKEKGWISEDPDLLEQMIRDDDVVAREGLALGLLGEPLPGIERIITPWYSEERDDRVKNAILEFMAGSSDVTPGYAAIVIPRFKQAGPDTTMRKRLITSSIGTRIYNELKKINIIDSATHSNLELFGTTVNGNIGPTINGNIDMSNNNNLTFGNVKSIKGKNISFGDMINSANENISNVSNAEVAETLNKIVDLLQSQKEIPQEQALAIAGAVKDVASSPTTETKTALSKLIEGVHTATVMGSAAELGWKAIEAAMHHWPF